MCRRDIEEGSDVFQRKEIEQVGVSADKFFVALLGCLAVESHIAVIDGGEYSLGGTHHYVFDVGIFSHTLYHLMNWKAIYITRRHSNDRYTSLHPGQ